MLSGSGTELCNPSDEGWFQGQTHMSTVLETMSSQNANNWLAMGNVGVSCTHAGGVASYPPVGTAVTGQVGSLMGLE